MPTSKSTSTSSSKPDEQATDTTTDEQPDERPQATRADVARAAAQPDEPPLASVHQPGQPPGGAVDTGPVTMTINEGKKR